jgi:hypothetical protein
MSLLLLEMKMLRAERRGVRPLGSVVHCKDDFPYSNSFVLIGMANVDIRSSGHGNSNSTGDAGSSFASSDLLAPRSPEVKNAGFEIEWLATQIALESESLPLPSSPIQSGRLRGIVTDGRASPSGGFRVELPHAQGREAENLIHVRHSSQVDVVAEEKMAHGRLETILMMTAVHAR